MASHARDGHGGLVSGAEADIESWAWSCHEIRVVLDGSVAPAETEEPRNPLHDAGGQQPRAHEYLSANIQAHGAATRRAELAQKAAAPVSTE